MKPLPLPLRVAAGLAATAVEGARELPTKLAGLPVTVVSQVMQLSMRVQQQVTELAIKGDEVLATLRPVEETPEWATFDEDLADDRYDVSTPRAAAGAGQTREPAAHSSVNGYPLPNSDTAVAGLREADEDPWEMEEHALASEAVDEIDASPHAPAGIGNYDDLSLPQLRARLRTLTLSQLEELLDYERSHAARPSFIGMLTRRIGTVSAAGGDTHPATEQ